MSLIKYILIVILDWIDANILRHCSYSICCKIAFSKWWSYKDNFEDFECKCQSKDIT